MENRLCNMCEHCKKLPFSTVFECGKYGDVLLKNPPECCQQCLDEMDTKVNEKQETKVDDKSNKLKMKTNGKKDVIEVK